MIYDINGNNISEDNRTNRFKNQIRYSYHRDETTGTFYSKILIPQSNPVGEKQYPFVYWPNYPNGGTESAYQLAQRKNYLVLINAGKYGSPYGEGVTLTGLPRATVIQNSVVLQQGTSENSSPTMDWVLTIDNTGTLGYARYYDSASNMVANGIVSAVSGFIPILTNYTNIDDIETVDIDYMQRTDDSQRQVLGQYGNGDYAIITAEGRGYQGGNWFTMKQLQTLCKQIGLKFAFCLDGGGSTETVIGKKQLNPFYNNTYGRNNPTFIFFNGTDTFGAPQ